MAHLLLGTPNCGSLSLRFPREIPYVTLILINGSSESFISCRFFLQSRIWVFVQIVEYSEFLYNAIQYHIIEVETYFISAITN